jgi:hypothetical protein
MQSDIEEVIMISRKRDPQISLLVVLVILALSAHSNAQNLDFNIAGSGARAEAMGGAFIGLSDDATSVVWNPAGLTVLERPEASAVGRFYTHEFTFEDETESLSHFNINFGSYAHPFTLGDRKVVLALALQRQLNFTYSDEYVKITGGVDTGSLGVGIQVTPLFSVGVVQNAWSGNPKAQLKPGVIGDDYAWDFSGFNFVLGAKLDFTNLRTPKPFKLGVVLRTPFNLKDSETDPTDYEMPLMYGIGGAYHLGENWTISSDFEIRNFGDSEIILEDGSSGPLAAHEENTNQFRLGVEYLLVKDLGIFPLRLGYLTVPTLLGLPNENGEWTGDPIIGDGFTIGSGYISERFTIEATFSYTGYDLLDGNNETLFSERSNVWTVSSIFYF